MLYGGYQDLQQLQRESDMKPEVDPWTKACAPQRFCEVEDDSSHHYVIPADKRDEWDAFCEIPEGDERGWDVPDWATRIDGGHLTFENWKIE